MSWIGFDEIVTKVYDLLRTDRRTSTLDWHRGRRHWEDIQRFPAGSVYLGDGTLVPHTIPGGDSAPFQVVVTIAYSDQAGEVERLKCAGLEAVLAVIADTARGGSSGWDIGLSTAYVDGIAWRAIDAPALNMAAAEIRIAMHAIPS